MERSRGRTGGFDRLKVMAPALSFVRTIVSHGRAMYRPGVGVRRNSPRGVFARGDCPQSCGIDLPVPLSQSLAPQRAQSPFHRGRALEAPCVDPPARGLLLSDDRVRASSLYFRRSELPASPGGCGSLVPQFEVRSGWSPNSYRSPVRHGFLS